MVGFNTYDWAILNINWPCKLFINCKLHHPIYIYQTCFNQFLWFLTWFIAFSRNCKINLKINLKIIPYCQIKVVYPLINVFFFVVYEFTYVWAILNLNRKRPAWVSHESPISVCVPQLTLSRSKFFVQFFSRFIIQIENEDTKPIKSKMKFCEWILQFC